MQLTGQQINDFLSTALMESQIGEVVREAVLRAIKSYNGKSHMNPVEEVVKNHIKNLITKILLEDKRIELDEYVRNSVERYLCQDAIDKIVGAIGKRYHDIDY